MLKTWKRLQKNRSLAEMAIFQKRNLVYFEGATRQKMQFQLLLKKGHFKESILIQCQIKRRKGKKSEKINRFNPIYMEKQLAQTEQRIE